MLLGATELVDLEVQMSAWTTIPKSKPPPESDLPQQEPVSGTGAHLLGAAA